MLVRYVVFIYATIHVNSYVNNYINSYVIAFSTAEPLVKKINKFNQITVPCQLANSIRYNHAI